MSASFKSNNDADMEPAIEALLTQKWKAHLQGPYTPKGEAEVAELLQRYISKHVAGGHVTAIHRMGGGASKEQFVFDLENCDQAGRYVLRMDPLGAIVETDRRRECEALRAFAGHIPVPRAVWLDADGLEFGQPAVIMEFTNGVTKPSDPGARVNNGIGTVLGPRLRKLLAPQFIENLVAIHDFDWRGAELPSYQVPDADPLQAARWRANCWSRIWREDKVASMPVATLAEAWLAENLPATTDLSFIHGDYRTGNFLFEESSGRMTAILDWELGHIGDFHEDLGFIVQRTLGTVEEGRSLVCGLFERDEFLDLYQEASGRTISPRALHFYEVLATLESMALLLGTGVSVAGRGHNHQDVLLTWLATAGHQFHFELCRLLEKDVH